ncbi:MAG TPA: TetR/AcrR family transcriptional regulator [Pseudolabrys sp.]|nr:TetR/AcrR family transcriptional regulator [Pseudolabrys sp.]
MAARRAAKAESRPEGDTRTRILDAAERLIAEHGFHGVSLREITAEARANTAAVHYYFRGKEELLEAVVDRRAGIMVGERLKRINALTAGPQPPSLEALILAYVAPGLTECFDSGDLRKQFGRVRARFSQETDPAMRAIMRRHFKEPGVQFLKAVAKIIPQLTRRELQWRFHIMVGTLIYLMAQPGKVQAVDGETDTYDPDDVNEALRYYVPMLAAIFRAPPSSVAVFDAAVAEVNGALARASAPAIEPATPKVTDDSTAT